MGLLKWLQDRVKDFNTGAEADLAFRQGVFQRQQGNYDKAIELFNKALELNPRHVSAYIYRGHVRRQVGDVDGARADYDAAFRLDPFAASDWVNTPLPPRVGAGTQTTDVDSGDTAVPAYPTGQQINPNIYISQGEDQLRRKDYRRALESFSRAIELNESNLRAYQQRATTYYQMGNLEAAIADYDEALRIKPDSAEDHVGRGLMHYFNGDQDAALEDFTRAIELNPQYALAYNNRATIYREQNQLDMALADYDRAVDLDPRNPLTFLNRGETYALQGDFYRAIDDYNNAIFMDRDNPDLYLARAKARTENGDTMGAISDYRRYLDVGGGEQNQNRAEIEEKIKSLRGR